MIGNNVNRSKPTLLLIHGHMLSHASWQPQIEALERDVDVIAPDLPGHGDASPNADACPVDALADRCVALLNTHGVERSIVCGLSLGGYIALALCHRSLTCVAGLALCATRAEGDMPQRRAQRTQLVASVERNGTGVVIDDLLPHLFAQPTYHERPELVAAVRCDMERTTPQGCIAAIVAMRDRPDQTAHLAAMDVPALIIHGADDTRTPRRYAQMLRDGLPNAELHIVPGAGHLLNVEQPDHFNTLLRAFVDRCDMEQGRHA
jgi:pimeloyl-ACP methyl ester carboxylesterase